MYTGVYNQALCNAAKMGPRGPLWVISCRGAVKVACPLYPRKLPRHSFAVAAVKCQKATYAVQQNNALFDHLVGGGEQRRGHGQAERLSGLEVDYEFEFGRLNDR